MGVRVGEAAPGFECPAHDGSVVSLDRLRGRSVVLFFYPRDETSICTKEACGFRDSYERFKELQAAVFGVSADGRRSHQAFAGRHRLPFLLLCDEDRVLRRKFGVKRLLGLFDGRETFVIDESGIVRHVVRAAFSAGRHVEEALQTLQSLAAKRKAPITGSG